MSETGGRIVIILTRGMYHVMIDVSSRGSYTMFDRDDGRMLTVGKARLSGTLVIAE
jgi:hypothetical protein